MTETLQWGLRDAVPSHAPVAWGARAIIGASWFDLLPDRQSIIGKAPLRAAMRRALISIAGLPGYLDKAQSSYSKLRLEGKINPNSGGAVTLVNDYYVRIEADPRASHGYLYLAAWFDAEDIDTTNVAILGDPSYEDDDYDNLRWSSEYEPPAIGEDRVWIMGNKPMRGTVVGYRNTHGYLLALVVPYEPFCNPHRLPVVGLFGCDIIESEESDG
jgi:hypothetical protein